jgi:alpha-D-ribose 1-methylphosphonate 5-triphosphate synthase subunit PhnG
VLTKLQAEEDALRQTAEKLDEWKSEVLHSMEEAQQTRSSIKAADAAADAQDVTQLIAAAD